MISRAVQRTAWSARSSFMSSKGFVGRSMHTSSATYGASRRAGWIAGTAVVTGAVAFSIFSQDRLRMEEKLSALPKEPTGIPPTIDAKSVPIAEVIVEEAQPPADAAVESQDAEVPPKEGEQDEDPGSAAFNPETGEINWDCPCLGGMAHGPCGPEFREAFSCFVYSEQDPKGIDCVEKFKGMQDCFRAHPEAYGEELDDDEEATLDAAAPAAEEVQAEAEPEPEQPKRKWRSRYED